MESKYLVKTYNPDGVRGLPGLVFTHGKEANLYDTNGNVYLDFNAGICVSSMGHGDSELAEAVAEQMKNVTHTSNLYHTIPPLKLSQTLVENTKFDKVFFANSGTEANEAALKFARLYGKSINETKTDVIAFRRSFHGRTCGSLSLTHKPAYREPFAPLLPGVAFADFNDIDSVRDVMKSNNVCAVFVEPIQGEGGLYPASIEFFRQLRALCDEQKALLVCDEVQTGLGRTGYLFAHEPYGVQPDVVTLAKPLAGGLPIGATLLTNHVADHVRPGNHGTTFGGNPVACAAAQVVVNRLLSRDFLEKVRQVGRVLCEAATKLQEKYPTQIRDVRMPVTRDALYVGLEFHTPVKDVVSAALKQGLLVIAAGENVVRICPPLIISKRALLVGLNVLDGILAARESERMKAELSSAEVK